MQQKKNIEIDVNLKLNCINLSKDNFIFATLYKENTLICSNFINQIKIEEKKINKLLDQMLQELNKIEKPLKIININFQKQDSIWKKILKKLKNFI